MEDIQNYEAVQVLGARAYRKFNSVKALGVFNDLMRSHKYGNSSSLKYVLPSKD